MTKKQSDDQLIQQARAGNKHAFDLLMQKYQQRLAKVLKPYLHDPNDIADVTQDSFLKAYKALKTFRGDSQFYTWLYRIAINTAKNHLMRASKRPPQVDAEILERSAAEHEPQQQDTPDRLAESDEAKTIILDRLKQFPKNIAETFILREFKGLSYAKIAEKMHCPIGTVRSRLHRVRKFIQLDIGRH